MRLTARLSPIVLCALIAPLLFSPTIPADAGPIGFSSVVTSRFAVDPDGSTMWLPSTFRRRLIQVTLPDGQITGTVNLGSLINGVELSPDGMSLATTQPFAGQVVPVQPGSMNPEPPIATGRGPRLPTFSPDGSGLCVLSPPDNQADVIDWINKTPLGVMPFDSRPFGSAHSQTPDCMAVSFPRDNTITVFCGSTHLANGSADVLRPRHLSVSVGEASAPPPPGEPPHHHPPVPTPTPAPEAEGHYIATSRAADAVFFVTTRGIEVVATVDLRNPGNLDANADHAFVIYRDGRRMAVICTNPADPAFGTVLQVVKFPRWRRVEAVRIAKNTGVAYAVTWSHRRVFTLDPSAMPLDGSTVNAGNGTRIHN